MRANSIDEQDGLIRRGVLESSLDDVIRKRVAKKLLKLIGAEQLFNHYALGLRIGDANALLDDVGAELLPRQGADLAMEAQAEWAREGQLVQIENVLNNVVAERILHKLDAVGSDLANQVDLLVSRSVVDAALKDAAAVTMGADDDAVLSNRIEDELSILRLEVVETLLDDVVAVQILDEMNHATAEELDDSIDLEELVRVMKNVVEKN
jgi:hypothetical protein